jgi:hypothetical protein
MKTTMWCSAIQPPVRCWAFRHYLRMNNTFNKTQPDLFELLNLSLEDGEQFIFESQLSTYNVHIKVQHLIVPHQALFYCACKMPKNSINRFNN